PANFNAFGTASTGPIPITSGATPATANERNFNNGVNPSASAFSRSINNTDAADRKSTRLNSSHVSISYAVFCLKKKKHKKKTKNGNETCNASTNSRKWGE